MANIMAKKLSVLTLLVFLAAVIVIVALSIVAIVQSQNIVVIHLLIVILVLTVFAGLLPLVHLCWFRHSAENYSLRDEELQKKAQRNATAQHSNGGAVDNVAYVKESSQVATQSASSSAGSGQWVSNYVPYEGYPSGTIATTTTIITNQSNGLDVVDGGGSSSTWRQNYVPHQEADSNRQ